MVTFKKLKIGSVWTIAVLMWLPTSNQQSDFQCWDQNLGSFLVHSEKMLSITQVFFPIAAFELFWTMEKLQAGLTDLFYTPSEYCILLWQNHNPSLQENPSRNSLFLFLWIVLAINKCIFTLSPVYSFSHFTVWVSWLNECCHLNNNKITHKKNLHIPSDKKDEK